MIDATRRQKFGISTTALKPRALVRELDVPGAVEWEERALVDVTMRAEAWVERLYVAEAGAQIEKGDRLALLYSPEMYGAQREFLAARGSAREVTKIERLRLLGLTTSQIRAVDKRGDGKDTFTLRSPATGTLLDFHDVVEGTHLAAGTRVARIGRLDQVRATLRVHERDINLLKEGMAVTLHRPGATPVRGEVSLIERWVDDVTRRANVRVSVETEREALLPGMTVRGTLEIPLGESLAVPVNAVVSTGKRDIVFVDRGEGRLVPTDVVLGDRAGEWYAVLEGLAAGDEVVSGGAFLVMSESKMSAAQRYWGKSGDGR